MDPIDGFEQLVDAFDCEPDALRSRPALAAIFTAVIDDLGLRPLGPPAWHVFPGAGGVTGIVALRESHLACHTFPERGVATFNLYCCRRRPSWAWERELRERLGARRVVVRTLARGTSELSDAAV